MKRSSNTNLIARTKKFAIMTVLALVTFISYSFAGGTDELSNEIRISFKKDFQNAQIISSEVKKNFTKVTFKMDNSVMYALPIPFTAVSWAATSSSGSSDSRSSSSSPSSTRSARSRR